MKSCLAMALYRINALWSWPFATHCHEGIERVRGDTSMDNDKSKRGLDVLGLRKEVLVCLNMS